jgi:iron complex outermembrane recepter protein
MLTSMKKISYLPRRPALALAVSALLASYAQGQTLKDVVVNVNRFPQDSSTLTAGVSVITQDEIRAAGASSVNEVIVRLLGVPSRQDLSGGGEYALDLRGFGEAADRNQIIVVDGQRLNEADIGGSRLAGIPIDTVVRIEILRGSGAVLYGEGASGGVISITTKSGLGKDRKNTASVYAGVATYGLRDLRASATVASGGFSADIAGQRTKADNYRDNFRSDFDAQNLGVQWTNSIVRLGARYSRDSLESGWPGSLTDSQFAANPRHASTPSNRGSVDNERRGMFVNLYLDQWELSADLGSRDKLVDSSFGSYTVDAKNKSLQVRNDASFSLGANALIFGLDQEEWRKNNLGFDSVATRKSKAIYVKDEVAITSTGTRIGLGLRSERITKDDVSPFSSSAVSDRQRAWELSLHQNLSAQLSAYGRVGNSFRLPSVDEFNFTVGGAPLRAQTSRDLELGARWKLADSKVELRYYNSRLTNEIGFDPNIPNPTPFSQFGANVNFDPTKRQGIEVDASHTVSPSLSLGLNAGVRQAKFRSGAYAGNDVPLAPGRTLALRANWKPQANHQLSGGVQWISSAKIGLDNQCEVPSYAVADVRYAYTWNKAEFALGVTNLFDRRYFTQAFACAGSTATALYPEAGRAVTASVRVSF